MNQLPIQENDTMDLKDHGTQSTKLALSSVGKLNFIFMIFQTPLYIPSLKSHRRCDTIAFEK